MNESRCSSSGACYLVSYRSGLAVRKVEQGKIPCSLSLGGGLASYLVRRVEKEGLTISEWVRVACMVTSAFDGDVDAWRLTFRNASEKAKEMVGRLFSELGVRKFYKRG